MVVYFSGTGNSKWAAKEIASITGDTVKNISEDITLDDEVLGIVFPIYAWGMPAPMEKYLKEISVGKNTYVYMICTCGSNCGYADSQVEGVIGRKLNASLSLSLPNNYIQGGNCEDEKGAKAKFKAAKPLLHEFAEKVKKRENGVAMLTRGPLPHLMTSVVHPLFNFGMDSGKSFTFTDACISCGKCAKDCPTKNIQLVDGHPVWGKECCNCVACINNCDMNAIKYGKHDRRTYHFKEEYVD